MQVTSLSDGRVHLTVPVPHDVDTITTACQDREIADWTTVPDPYTRADAVRFVGDIVPRGWAASAPNWAIRTSPDGVLLGVVGFLHHERTAPEIGYWIAADARGRGLATAAVNLACDFAFDPDGLATTRIEWRAFAGNLASAAVARHVGFRFEGTLRRGTLHRGVPRDTWIAGLLSDDPRVPADGWPI
ncbi:GNAT family N-acetyltransferase [Rhodococcus sp. NPDC003382]